MAVHPMHPPAEGQSDVLLSPGPLLPPIGRLAWFPPHIHQVEMLVPVEQEARCFVPQVAGVLKHEISVQLLKSVLGIIQSRPKADIHLPARE